jgi:hypothetical protein
MDANKHEFCMRNIRVYSRPLVVLFRDWILRTNWFSLNIRI